MAANLKANDMTDRVKTKRRLSIILGEDEDEVDNDMLEGYLDCDPAQEDQVVWNPPSEMQSWPAAWWNNETDDANFIQTPALSHSSRSTSSDSLTSGFDSLTTNDTPSSPSTSTLSSPASSDMAELTPSISSGSDSEDSDPLPLSLPIKIAAFALALLPIPTSFFTSRSNPPPLPVVHPSTPKTYAPHHRTASSTTLSPTALSPRGSSTNLSSYGSVNKKKTVSFDKVIVVSPHDSEGEYSDDE